VGGLLEAARVERERHERERAHRAEEERRRQEEAAAKAREERFAALAARQDAAWEDIEQLALSKKPASYDEAVALLGDLREVADRAGTVAAFAQRLAGLQERHARKATLMERIRKAGLTG
jgi:hypothetical protein